MCNARSKYRAGHIGDNICLKSEILLKNIFINSAGDSWKKIGFLAFKV
jgi:hypothetical protein